MQQELKFAKESTIIGSYGIPVDTAYLHILKKYRNEVAVRLKTDFEKEYKINPNSNKQVREFIEHNFKGNLWMFKKDKNKYTFDKDRFELVKNNITDEFRNFLYKKLNQMPSITRKIESIIEGVYHDRVYYSQKHYGALTGRSLSYKFNIQNFPKGKRIDKLQDLLQLDPIKAKDTIVSGIRGCIGHPNKRLIIADLKQIEPRMMAHRLKLYKLIEAFKNFEDIYSNACKEMFGNTEKRDKLKKITMSFLYGAGQKRLKDEMDRLGVNIKDQTKLLNKLNSMWYGIKDMGAYYSHKFQKAYPGSVKIYDNFTGQFYLVKDNSGQIAIPEQGYVRYIDSKYHMWFSANTNQAMACSVLKMWRSICLQKGLKVIFDEYDKLVIETTPLYVTRDHDLTIESLRDLQQMMPETLPLDIDIKTAVWYE